MSHIRVYSSRWLASLKQLLHLNNYFRLVFSLDNLEISNFRLFRALFIGCIQSILWKIHFSVQILITAIFARKCILTNMTYRYDHSLIDEQPYSKYLSEAPFDVRTNNRTLQRVALICQTLNLYRDSSDCLIIKKKLYRFPARGRNFSVCQKRIPKEPLHRQIGLIAHGHCRISHKVK